MTAIDPFDAAFARRAPEPLRTFNEAGVLEAADVHVAERLLALAGETDGDVALAAALAVRAPRMGSVYVDLATIRETAAVEGVDLAELPWPDPEAWLSKVAASTLTGGPLVLEGSALYLDRYWREERRLAADLRAFVHAPAAAAPPVDVLEGRQRDAAEAALSRRLSVIAGGPGTGKTYTVARIVALLTRQALARGEEPPLVALAAQPAKAAARLAEEVHALAQRGEFGDAVDAHLLTLSNITLDRLLSRRPGSHSRYSHDRANRLPHDVIVVDETSMVSLSLMARLVEAVRDDAKLILVGDPEQLASVEAGAVFGDLVRPGAPGVVQLDEGHRYGPGIDALAQAIRAGDQDRVVASLDGEGVTWLPVDVARQADVPAVRRAAVQAAATVIEHARRDDARAAIRELGAFRVLLGHRRGPYGVATWVARIEGWLAEAIPGFAARGRWYPGRPLLVTENDYGLGLFNGDAGVILEGPQAAFERRGEILRLAPTRLAAVDTVYAMTIHKSQGSQYETAAVLLPDQSSRVLTRELLYTAVTRARERLIVAGTEEAIRAAVARPVTRASGLAARLWDA